MQKCLFRLYANDGSCDVNAKINATAANYPLPRAGTVDEVANVVYFLSSEDNGYMTGTSVRVDGGALAKLIE